MINVKRLKAAQVLSGFSNADLAGKIGINPCTLYRKMAGKSEFTASELLAIKEALSLDIESFNLIFFAQNLRKCKLREEDET